MGFLIAALIGLFGQKALSTKLYRGEYSLAQSYAFGLIGGVIVLAVAGSYVAYVAAGDNSGKSGWTFATLRGMAVPVGLFAFVSFVGIWRAASSSGFGVKLMARYFSVFFLSTAGACLMLGWLNVMIALAVYWISRRFRRPGVRDVLAN